MFMRLVQVRVKTGALEKLQQLYNERVIPALRQVKGCFYAGFMQNSHVPDECISMTLWESQEDAVAYEKSGVFENLLNETRPYLSESSDWKIQLSQDLTLEYVPVPEEPEVKMYSVTAQSNVPAFPTGSSPLWLRTVALKIRPGRLEEFRRLYKERIMPELHKVKGCRYVYLTESAQKQNEVISVTVWDSKHDAENYEHSGLYERLVDSIKHTLSELFQWKMELEKEKGKQAATSEDLTVEHYDVIVGKTLK